MHSNDEKPIYQACSISKLPLAYFAVKMAQDGRLDLDRPLHEYNPDILRHFESEPDRERAKRITAHMVLTHTTGLPNKGYVKMSFQGEPGEKSIYSGVGMYVLQEVLELLKGRTLDVFAKEELFDRLGMTHTSYVWQKEYEQLAVYGFRKRGPQRDTPWSVRCNAAYSLRTSSEEFTKFLQWFLRGADLTPEWQKKMFTEYAKVPPKAGVPGDSRLYRNLGWVTEDSDEFGKIRYHGGNNVAYKGMAIMIPERKITLCYFFNGDTRYNLHGPLTDLFLKPKNRLYAHTGGVPLPAKPLGTKPLGTVPTKP
jgi:CubicO group peptidase (beta-lactamase class C family)